MGGSTDVGQNTPMNPFFRPSRLDTTSALDEGLAEWFGWFAAAPLSEEMSSLIDQLEAASLPLEPVDA